jgi:hypothetical protein
MTYKKHVLLVAMLDSVHTAKWLEQFVGDDIKFTIFPSKKYRYIHPKIHELFKITKPGQFNFYRKSSLRTSGYDDYIRFGLITSKPISRQTTLNALINRNSYDYVHALEIQGAGYLLADAPVPQGSKTIISNWGSDIYYFMKYEKHLNQIKSLLSKVDAYSAECVRDYDLARELGFQGIFLPCIPNAGGHKVPDKSPMPTERDQIIVKGYGGEFGRAGEVILIASDVLRKYPWVKFFFYSVTDDNYESLKDLEREFGDRVSFRRIGDKLSHSQMQLEYQKSRIYIGCSISDGISTSFLEAMTNGAFPIQTNTSCANEWVAKGAIASLVNVDSQEILREIELVIQDKAKLEMASAANRKVALDCLSSEYIKEQSAIFYKI